MANIEAMRVRRQQAAEAATAGAFKANPNLLKRRALSFDLKTRGFGSRADGESSRPPIRRQPSLELSERMSQIAPVVEKVLEAKGKDLDWAAEAARIRGNQPPLYCRPDDGAGGDAELTFVTTGSREWERATDEERRAVIAAFGANARVTSIAMAASYMADAHADD